MEAHTILTRATGVRPPSAPISVCVETCYPLRCAGVLKPAKVVRTPRSKALTGSQAPTSIDIIVNLGPSVKGKRHRRPRNDELNRTC